ncbi:PhoH family protein [uncultured Selenomonas sp.]|uniref:PhoH family protein n=1 Tax=uncultured Selenomonas sp. TaxID=159275 RepID=UPI0028D3C63F|nr:PhoH family protein [uncultured Selenomonas sp.]
MQETTAEIAFRDQQEAYAVLGDRDSLLLALQETFACHMVSRGGMLAVTGAAEDVAAARTLVEELLYYHRQGAVLTTHEVAYGARLVRAGRAEEVHALFSEVLLVTAKGKEVRAKTLGQRDYLAAIRRNAVTLGIGPAGTGKTYLAVVMAVAALRSRAVSRIILTRPAVEAGEHLGFLPGDLTEKINPYLRPLYDALQDILGAEGYQKMMSRQLIEVAPLAYMRGRTLEDAFIILDEAQNTTGAQMKMFLTRLGFGSRMVVTGDLEQVDLPRGTVSGLKQASQILRGVQGISIVRLAPVDIIRHEVVTRIVEAYGAWEKKRGDRHGD